jgi:hypothetical protein
LGYFIGVLAFLGVLVVILVLQIAWLVLGYPLNLLLSIPHPIYVLTSVSAPTFTSIFINMSSCATVNCMSTIIVVFVE